MFDHPDFDKIEYSDLPIGRDVFVLDQKFMGEYEAMMLRFFEGSAYEYIGLITDVSIKHIDDKFLQLQWMANIYDRFHAIEISLPRELIAGITGCWKSDEKIRLFVDSDWINNLHNRNNCIFSLIDSAGMKAAIRDGEITRERLVSFRDGIDRLSEMHKDISFISFADTVILKYVWGKSIGLEAVCADYSPEYILEISHNVCNLFAIHFNLKSYAVLTQGVNEFYEDRPLHISDSKNHISLNSFGTPFAQLIEIEAFARKAIRSSIHKPFDLYIEEHLFWSLKFSDHDIKQSARRYSYDSKISNNLGWYYPVSFQFMKDSLRTFNPGDP